MRPKPAIETLDHVRVSVVLNGQPFTLDALEPTMLGDWLWALMQRGAFSPQCSTHVDWKPVFVVGGTRDA